MRNLNRIIFINSANIPYADDIYLDGNVHFIGTQGVGKSTVLRAILFFYNADTQKLGIPVEKQSYTEYYFPYSNSYIIYEVTTEQGAFCILSFKSMGRVCYRFIDSPYRMEFFVDENRTAYSGNDRIRAALDQYGVDYSRIIYTYDEYRNILYGNGAGPEMSRYSLMESKQYQNIPRTIQNVLLNSKLDAEFIKKTIISSINEDETAIDLNTYKEHLKNFETRLRDIEEFQKRETQKQAKEITSLSAQVSRQQTALVQGCRELAATYRLTESQLPKVEEQKHQSEKARTALLNRRQELQEQSRQRCDKMQEALAILNNELQKAQQKEKEYARRQIEEIMERSARKEEWKNKQQGLQEEQRILTSHYTEISTKYKSLIQSLDEQWNRIHEAKIKQLEGLNNTFNARIEEARRQHEAATEALYQEYEQLSQQLHPERSSKQNELTALDYQMQLCRKETFFEAEQEELKHRIQSYTGLHMSKKNRINNAQLIIKELTLKWEEELQKGLKEKDEALMQLQAEHLQLRPRMDELETFLKNSKSTLQGWLKEHKKGWEENIGKLCDESILWQTNLSPKIVDEGTSFYGISISLQDIERHIRSIDDYQAEHDKGIKRLAEIQAETLRLQQEKETLEEQLKAKYQPRIKEQKDVIAVQEYELEKLEQQYQKDMLDLDDWKKKAEAERTAKLRKLEEEKQRIAAELKEIDGKLNNLNREKSEKLNQLKQEWNRVQQDIAHEKETQAGSIRLEDKEEQQRIATEKAEYERQMKQELHSQGADTERLQQISSQLRDIDRELQFIKEHATLLYPEGTACADVLLAGEEGGANASTVFSGMGLAAIFKFIVDGLKMIPADIAVAFSSFKGALGMKVYPALLGVGYIVGPKTASYMFTGSLVGWMVIIPLICLFGANISLYPAAAGTTIADLYAAGGADAIWSNYVKYIGAGAIATGGIISLIKSLPLIASTFRDAMKSMKGGSASGTSRTEKDLPMPFILGGILLIILIIWLAPAIPVSPLGALLIVIFGIFFSTVSARMVGMIGSSNNPVSGMTIATLLIATMILKATGNVGIEGMIGSMAIASVICICAAIAADTSQDLKTGYLLGATPVKQQIGELIGVIAAGLAIGGVLYLLDSAWGYGGAEVPAPQATLMKMIVEGIMGGNLPWNLVFTGVFLAIALEILRIPVMPFAIGLYLPIYLNTSIMIGGVVRWFMDSRKNVDAKLKEEQTTRGTLFCAGMIAGEGLVGILLAVFAVFGISTALSIDLGNIGGVVLMIVMIACLLAFSMKKKKN